MPAEQDPCTPSCGGVLYGGLLDAYPFDNTQYLFPSLVVVSGSRVVGVVDAPENAEEFVRAFEEQRRKVLD